MSTATFRLPEAASLVPATSGHVWPIRRFRCGAPAALYVAGVCLNRIGMKDTSEKSLNLARLFYILSITSQKIARFF